MRTLPAALQPRLAFDVQEAEAHGLDGAQLSRLVAAGSLRRAGRGWYTPHPPGDPALDHLVAAHVAHTRTGLPMTGWTALLCRRLPVHDLPGRRILLAATTYTRGRRDALIVQPVLPLDPGARHVGVAEALAVTGLLDPQVAVAAGDAAVRRRLVTLDEVSAVRDALARRRGSRGARYALGLVDPRRESPGESRLAWLLHGWGFEAVPQLAVDLGGRTVYADFRVAGTRVLIEFDGAIKYADPDALFAEKRREDALRALGWVVVRVVWADLYRPEVLLRRLEAALRQAA